jgi:type IV secretion system protein VirB4
MSAFTKLLAVQSSKSLITTPERLNNLSFFRSEAGGDEWFRSAGDPSKLVSITRFISEHIFATAAGGYGMSFTVQGIDDECLSAESLDALTRELLAGQRLIPTNVVSYYIARKRRVEPSPHLHVDSPNPAVAETQRARLEHLKGVGFTFIDLFLTLYIPPDDSRFKLRTPGQHKRGTSNQIKQLESLAGMLSINLQRFGLRRMGRDEICQLYGYIANLNSGYPSISSFNRVAQQLPRESIQWNDDGLKIGRQHAKVFSMLSMPKNTRPNLFGDLLRMDADMVLVLETQRKGVEDTRSDVNKQETFTNICREKLHTLLAYFGDTQLLAIAKTASSQSADKSVSTLSAVLDDLNNGITYTKTSLIGIIHSAVKSDLDEAMPHVHRIGGASQAVFVQEGIGALSGFASFFPGAKMGGHSTNVRRKWLREDHVANLTLIHAPYRGEPFSETLEDEALAIFETRDSTEFAYNPYTPLGVRGIFGLGETGRGKTFVTNFLVDSEPKYGGFVFIFDVGRGYESTVLKHGGQVVRIGLDGPRLNPFALEDTERNHRFVQRLVRMLLLKGGATITPQQEEEINMRVSRMFALPRKTRRLKHLILPLALQPYLNKWVEGGVYGNVFDNVEDQLELSRMVVFDFELINAGQEQNDLMEPLISWIRWRIAEFTHDADNLGVPKLEVYDECWRYFKDEQMADMIVETAKTGRKHLGGIMMLTQSVEDLRQYASVIRKNCPDAMFMGGSFSRSEYDIFELNPHQLDLIAGLKRGEMLFVRKDYAKVLKLSVDERSHWHYTSRPQDRRRRDAAIEKYGPQAFDHLLIETASN